MTTTVCGYTWCEAQDDPQHSEHIWSDSVDGSTLLGRPRHAAVWNSVQDGEALSIMVSVYGDADDDDIAEIWLTIDQATYLRDALTKAIENAEARPGLSQ
ncbi:hypothetical protein NWT09_00085 [Mycolicibacterium sp. jd]|uniref:hypothetical protein n=1 Tax=unclassified Mycolicibacterium TaxID=2636767 RepID=UPI00351B89CD